MAADRERGWQIELAKKAKISRGYLTNLLARRRTASPTVANRLAIACKAMGIKATRDDWLFPSMSKSDLFPTRER